DSEGNVRVWDVRTGNVALLLKAQTKGVTSVAWRRDGARLASIDIFGNVKIWDGDTGKELTEIRGIWGGAPVWSPDGERLATSGGIWEAVNGKLLVRIEGIGRGFAWSPDGKPLASVHYENLIIADAATGQRKVTLRGHSGVVEAVAWSPDGSRLASASHD